MSSRCKTIDLSINSTLKERFEDKYVVSPCSCWIWTAATTRGGYGHIGVSYVGGRKMSRANRVSYALYIGFGKGEDHMLVCHKCDNPLCVNPDHLFLGTDEDNMVDKVAKGRHVYGVTSKIDRETAMTIRKMTNDPQRVLTFKKIGEKFGIKESTVSSIANNTRWVE